MTNRLSVFWMNRKLTLMKPAIMTVASYTGRAILIHLITVCLKLANLAVVKCLKKRLEKNLLLLSVPTTREHIASMPVCLMFGCSTVLLTWTKRYVFLSNIMLRNFPAAAMNCLNGLKSCLTRCITAIRWLLKVLFLRWEESKLAFWNKCDDR